MPDGDIGKWVLDRNAILKIGDNLFLHGGIGPTYANWTIHALNAAVRERLANPNEVEGTILLDEHGPLWYRGLAKNDEAQESDHLELLLRNFGVKRIIIGHTPTPGIILPRFDGKVILADVGLCRYYGDNLACLIIEGDVLTAIHRDGSIRIPDDTGQESLLEYLQSLAKLEPNNSTINNRIQALISETTSTN